ncbi:MAG: outer membrane lipoprotein carrier protein LolA [Chitinophagales bacterium]|nr:outer membrane lipoprotein carrier protein LolA [Chitinophagales bacterium]
MKKIIAVIIVLISIQQFSFAQQNDAKATEILKGVSAKYKTYKSVQGDFNIVVENGKNNTKDVQTGTLFVKGEKYKVALKNQEITSDNVTIWTYLKDANEVQINTYEPDDNTITPSQIFTIYEKNFLYAFIEEKTVNGKVLQYIELTPIDKTKPFFKIKLAIDKVAKAVQSAIVFDKNGNRYTYEIKNFIANPNLADTFFTFDNKAHPGIEVVDLR